MANYERMDFDQAQDDHLDPDDLDDEEPFDAAEALDLAMVGVGL